MAEKMELPPFRTRGTSFLKTCFNGLNALSGIGLITIPYTLSQAGWSGLAALLSMAIVTCYTGLLINRCLDANPSIKSYPEIGWYAFGQKGKLIVSIFMYLELYLVPTGFLILEGDNLHKLFPNVGFEIAGSHIGGKRLFTMLAGLLILPSMWVKDLSWLSFVSASGVMSTILVSGSVLWVGGFDGVGFSNNRGQVVLNLKGLPTALSLYAFCYGAHAVFPTLYSSMKDKTRFPKVLFISFGLSTLSYMSMAVVGYLMFGQHVESQVTLNLPTNKLSSKIAIYTTLAGPIAKYALIITPIANAIENQLSTHWFICIIIRTLLLLSTVLVALLFPFFGLLMSLVGAILNVTVSILLPSICYLKIFGAQKGRFEFVMIVGIILVAVLVGVMGTYSSVIQIMKHI